MEPGAILKMLEDTSRHHCFIIGVIEIYDDRKIQSVLKHQSRGARVQVKIHPK